MKKIAFLDRDGTLMVEPPDTYQINSLEELYLIPGVISGLKNLIESGYSLVMITNQDNLGSPENPRENYEKVNKKLFEILESEGIIFWKILECPHSPDENCVCRKPKTGMVSDLLKKEEVHLSASFVIGDRESDIEFAKNIGVQGFLLSHSKIENEKVIQNDGLSFTDIVSRVISPSREAEINRNTKETHISVRLDLDGKGKYKVNTGLKFYDHMLEQLARHGGFDIIIKCKGDLEIDEHHTIEDTAIALGEAFQMALGDKRGIERYSWERILPMDEAESTVSLDISGRSFLVFHADFNREYVGDFPTEMLEHFYKSFCDASGINLNMNIAGKNTHHMVESSFKAFSRCLKDAVKRTGKEIPSTKGTL